MMRRSALPPGRKHLIDAFDHPYPLTGASYLDRGAGNQDAYRS